MSTQCNLPRHCLPAVTSFTSGSSLSCTHAHTHARRQAGTCTHARKHIRACKHAHTDAGPARKHTHTSVTSFTSQSTCSRTHAREHAHTYAHAHTHAWIYAHTHAQASARLCDTERCHKISLFQLHSPVTTLSERATENRSAYSLAPLRSICHFSLSKRSKFI